MFDAQIQIISVMAEPQLKPKDAAIDALSIDTGRLHQAHAQVVRGTEL
jgi:hypothetical protein